MRKQLSLELYQGKRGGRRPGAGRKRLHSKGVAHRTREKVTAKTGLHINFKVRIQIRNKTCLKMLRHAIQNARSHGLKVLHFSLQSNHVHLIVEAVDNKILTRGMRSLTITFSKGVHRGRIQLERYHLHVLRTLRETKNAVHYVLFNREKHAGLKRAHIDEFSSLGAVRDLKTLAREVKMTIVLRKIQELKFLDEAQGWMIRQVLKQQVF